MEDGGLSQNLQDIEENHPQQLHTQLYPVGRHATGYKVKK
jgi:hypothetical protein